MDKIIRIDILQGDWVKTVHKYMNMLGYGTKLDVNSGRLHVFNESEYETVYSIIPNGFYFVPYSDTGINGLLEDMYVMFNIKQPVDFMGHSLSISDIIKVTDDCFEVKYYMVCIQGFIEVTPSKQKGVDAYE